MSKDYENENAKGAGAGGRTFSGKGLKIAIVVSQFNGEITAELERGARTELLALGVVVDDIQTTAVPGAFELPLAAQRALAGGADAVIALGCVIRGETSHYDFICDSISSAFQTVSLKFDRPVIAGVLTTENIEQARARAGGSGGVGGEKGHKGRESALAAVEICHALSGPAGVTRIIETLTEEHAKK